MQVENGFFKPNTAGADDFIRLSINPSGFTYPDRALLMEYGELDGFLQLSIFLSPDK